MRIVRHAPGVWLGLLLVRLSLFGQDAAATNAIVTNTPAAGAAAVAEQQGEDEKYKRVTADIELLRAANQALSDKLAAMTEENRQMRADLAKLTSDSSVADPIKLISQKIEVLAQKIEEVDKKRGDDRQAISEEIAKSFDRLKKLLDEATATATAPRPAPRANPNPAPLATEPQNGVKYTVKSGERLIDILRAYNETFKSQGKKTISLSQLLEANPGVDPKHMAIGQTIIIPLPPD